MNKCANCGVQILDQTQVCPLCRCVMETEDSPQAGRRKARAKGRKKREKQIGNRYPDIRLKGRKLELAGRVVLFLSIVAGVLAVIINYRHPTDIWWSVIAAGGLAYLQLIMFFIIENEHAGYRSKVMIGAACFIAYVILIDYVSGFRRWSLDYVLPSAFLVMDVLIIVLMFVNIRNWQSYLLFQIFMILCSGVCVLLYFAGVIGNPVMVYTAFGFSCFMFLAAFIIGGRRASNELKRRFHVM